MSDDWTKRLANKIANNETSDDQSSRSNRITRCAEEGRALAAKLLFPLFTSKVDAIAKELAGEERGGLFRFLRKSPPPVLHYQIIEDCNFRFQTREAYGTRLEIEFDRGCQPAMKIDVATAEVIEGEYLPIFRDTGAIAGVQIWRERRAEGKHPDLCARLFLLLSLPALEDGLKVKDAVRWIYEGTGRSFNDQSAAELIEALISAA